MHSCSDESSLIVAWHISERNICSFELAGKFKFQGKFKKIWNCNFAKSVETVFVSCTKMVQLFKGQCWYRGEVFNWFVLLVERVQDALLFLSHKVHEKLRSAKSGLYGGPQNEWLLQPSLCLPFFIHISLQFKRKLPSNINNYLQQLSNESFFFAQM